MGVSVKCEIKDFKALKKTLDKMQEAPRKVLSSTLSDVRKRAPGWVAAEVVKVYGVKKGEVTGQKIGTVKVEGDSLKTVKIKYTGRLLTPTHFNMSPKAPTPGGGYTLKASIIKGERATLGKVKKLTKKQRAALGKNFTRSGTQTSERSPIMLMHTGAGGADKTQYIPFQRVSKRRDDLKVIKAISLPQMVGSERTNVGIRTTLNDNIEKRLQHHMKRHGL
jgi:hypothetical protein